jgi:hypothetical protein
MTKMSFKFFSIRQKYSNKFDIYIFSLRKKGKKINFHILVLFLFKNIYIVLVNYIYIYILRVIVIGRTLSIFLVVWGGIVNWVVV